MAVGLGITDLERFCLYLSRSILLAVGPWANYLMSLRLNFVICKVGLIITPDEVVVRIQ